MMLSGAEGPGLGLMFPMRRRRRMRRRDNLEDDEFRRSRLFNPGDAVGHGTRAKKGEVGREVGSRLLFVAEEKLRRGSGSPT